MSNDDVTAVEFDVQMSDGNVRENSATGVLQRHDMVIVAIYVAVVLIVYCLVANCLWFCTVRGNSMEPTISEGTIGVAVRFQNELQYGDLAVINMYSNEKLIKRIIGVPGDHVVIKDGILFINDEIIEEPYVVYRSDDDECIDMWMKQGKYFILGDNRLNSMDSRYFGVVDAKQIYGKFYKLFPLLS